MFRWLYKVNINSFSELINMEVKVYQQILDDIKEAMKAHDNAKRDCLRSVVSEIKNQTVNAGKEITEDICMVVLKKAVKQRNDSISNFKLGGRDDLAQKEITELKLIEAYLPKMLSELEVQGIVLKTINDNKIEEKKQNIGKIMKLISARPDANLIDKKYASQYLGVLLK